MMENIDIMGLVGMGTGLVGMIVAILNHCRINRMKSLDLRVRLRSLIGYLHSKRLYLVYLLEKSLTVKINIETARNALSSSQMRKFEDMVTSDKNRANEMEKRLPLPIDTFARLNMEELENKLVEMDYWKNEIEGICKRYEDELKLDYEEGKHIREEFTKYRDSLNQ